MHCREHAVGCDRVLSVVVELGQCGSARVLSHCSRGDLSLSLDSQEFGEPAGNVAELPRIRLRSITY